MDYDIIIGRTESEKRDYGKRGLVFLGKQYVKMGQNVSLSNKVYLDVAKTHVILVSGKRGCLTGDTLIFTDKGFKQIKDFDEKNDKVYSFNKDKKEFEIENAKLLVYDIQDEALLNIEFSNGKNIVVTKEHPLLLYENKELIWKIGCEIKKGDFLVGTANNENSSKNSFLLQTLEPMQLSYFAITKIDEIDGISKVYDLSVEKNHSFIANGIISHNSGKSYTLSVLTEGVADMEEDVKKNLAILIFDTMGIFWTMKYPNEKQRDLLEKWGQKPKAIDVKVFTPEGKYDYYKEKNVATDASFTLKTSMLSAFDWCSVFEIKISDSLGVLIESVLNDLEGKNYSIDDIIDEVRKNKKFENNLKLAVENRFIAAKSWGLFSKDGSKISDLLKGNQTSILDISCYNESNVKALVVGLLCKLILEERIDARKLEEQRSIEEGKHYFEMEEEKREMPLVWLIIDEAHNFLHKEKETPATNSLVRLLREGRQPGISLVLATQQPGEIHKDAMTQSDIVISHRLTAKFDIEALSSIMQTYLTSSLLSYFNNLPTEKGSALVLDDNSERIFPLAVKPKLSWHGGDTPSAVHKSKRLNLEI